MKMLRMKVKSSRKFSTMLILLNIAQKQLVVMMNYKQLLVDSGMTRGTTWNVD